MRKTSFCSAAVLAAVLAGCGSQPAVREAVPGQVAPAPRATLAAEQRRLAELFRGTPVVFVMQNDGSLRVSVPLEFSFDRGRHVVKPPLGAVLERIAKSQRHEATRVMVAAPADPNTRGLKLATERATSARDFMVGHGVDATRFTITALGGGDSVVVVVAEAPH